MPNQERIFINRTEKRVTHTLFIGCGGKGTEAVAYCRDLAEQELFDGSRKELYDFAPLQFIAIDSVKQDIAFQGKDHEIETIPIAAEDIEEIIGNEDFPPSGNRPIKILKNLPRRNYQRMLNTLPGASMGNSTCPPLGAINFLASWEKIRQELKTKLLKWKQQTGRYNIDTYPLERQNQIFIVASLYGGTGSGVHVHLTAMLRSILNDLEIQLKNTAIYGIFFLPDIIRNADLAGKRKLRANTYACLKELDYFLSGNPYILRLGTGHVEVKNQGTDYLFNKVFLVNDENLEKIWLTEEQVAKMIGEFLFHFSATSLGWNINARLVDTPTERCIQFAPEGISEDVNSDKRICAYSTFGMATIRIPYEVLKHNLAIDYAQEIMNELMLHPDDETAEEQRKITEQRDRLRNRFNRKDLIEDLELDKVRLEKDFKPQAPDFARFSRIEDYMKQDGTDKLDQILTKMQDDSRRLVSSADHIFGDQSFYDVKSENFDNKLGEKIKEIITAGGPDQCRIILSNLRTSVKTMLKEYENIRMENSDNNLQRHLKGLDEYLTNKRRKRFYNAKRLRQFNLKLPALKRNTERALSEILARRVIPFLETVEKQISNAFELMRDETRRFQKIKRKITQKEKSYEQSKLLLNAVPESLLASFICDFDYPPGLRPEDSAARIKKSGLVIDLNIMQKTEQRILTVSEFSEYPEPVADKIVELAMEEIAKLGSDQWIKSFETSGLYPRFGVGTEQMELESGIRVDAYRTTKETLNKHSAPYLEYASNEGFTECRETFLIHPDKENEKLRWAGKEPWPLGREISVLADKHLPHSFYSLSSLQMHHGIPLYAIHEIEAWEDDYEHMMKATDRPLHKFDLHFRKPVISITSPVKLTRETAAQLFEWAVKISKTEYPIFIMHGDTPILDLLDNEFIRITYFNLYEDVYLDLEDMKNLLNRQNHLADYLMEQFKVVYAQLNSKQPLDAYLKFVGSRARAEKVYELFESLAKQTIPATSPIKFKTESGNLKVFLPPHRTAEPRLRELLISHFLRLRDRPELKEGIDTDFIKNKIITSKAFRECFLEKCSDAADHLLMQGKSPYEMPGPLQELL